MWRRIPVKTRVTVCVLAVVLFGTTFVVRYGIESILSVLDEGFGYHAQTAAVALARYVDGDVLATAPSAAAAAAAVAPLDERIQDWLVSMHLAEIQVVRFLSGKETEIVYTSLEPTDPYYIPPGTVESIVEAPAQFVQGYGWHAIDIAGRPLPYMAGWAPIDDGGGRPAGQLMVLLELDRVGGMLRRAYLSLMGLAVAFSAAAGYVAWKFSSILENISITDGLMGIFNRKHFQQRLEFECLRSGRYGTPLSLVMLDIDHFKRINDTYGHAVGDLVLKRLAKWVQESGRTTDVVARYGGEEIAVILPHTGVAGAQEFGERLRLKVANEWVHDDDEEVTLRVTVSVGVAQFQRGMSAMDLVRCADAALYHSKENGRNRVTVWTDDIGTPPEEEVAAATTGHLAL